MNQDQLFKRIMLGELLDTLPEMDKDILIFWWLYGYTFKEIATLISKELVKEGKKPISSRTVGNRIHKIMEKLRKIAKDAGT